LYNFRVLHSFAAKLEAQGITQPFPVHIKIDTGMKRLGFAAGEVPELISWLKKYPQIRIESVFSHLAGSEDPSHDPFTLEQLNVFRNACTIIEQDLGYRITRHICNSAAISRFPDAHLDMVRLGIGMYGVGSNAREQRHLLTVGTLKTKVSQIRRLEAGETVGYGRRGVITAESSIAIIPIGYADGFSRLLGNGAHGVYVGKNFCKTVGNICMDMCMIDVTGIGCEEGDEVIIFSDLAQLNALAKALQTITYEVLTNVSARVKRVYVQE
jgi:alanine racemase